MTMKNLILFIGAWLIGFMPVWAWKGEVNVETPHMQIWLFAKEGQDLRMAYFGSKSATMKELDEAGDNMNFSPLPAFGFMMKTVFIPIPSFRAH